VISFSQKYRHSAEEVEDLKAFYKKNKGDMSNVLECIMLSTEDDIERFASTLRKLIKSGELPSYKRFEKSLESLKSSARSDKEREKEALEAEELFNKIRNKGSNKENAIVKTKQQRAHEDMVASLAAKYGGKKGAKFEEPSEEEFEKARQRLDAKRAKKH
jgi:DnaJ family protein C protein 9